jgi:hypothetical protein
LVDPRQQVIGAFAAPSSLAKLDETHFNFDKEVSHGVLNRSSLQSRMGLQIAPLAQVAY